MCRSSWECHSGAGSGGGLQRRAAPPNPGCRGLRWLLPLRQHPQGGIEAGAAVHALHVAAHVRRAQLQEKGTAGSARCRASSCLCQPGGWEGSTHPRAPAGCSHGEALLVKGLFSTQLLPPALCLQKKRPCWVCAFRLRRYWGGPDAARCPSCVLKGVGNSLAGVHAQLYPSLLVLWGAWLGWWGSPPPGAAQPPSYSWASWAVFQLLGLSWVAGGHCGGKGG